MVFIKWINAPLKQQEKSIIEFQKYRHILLIYLARFFSFLSDEEFYLSLFPLFSWGPFCNGGIRFAWGLSVQLAFVLGLGSTLKNYFGKRRPKSPPVWIDKDKSSEEFEFSFPSTHAMMSTAFAIHTIYHHQFIEMHTVGSEMIWIAYFVVWTVCIAVSRVYLGFHYFQDILVGWLVGLVVGTLTELFAQYSWVTIGSRSWPLVVGINVFLFFWMYFHPYDRSSLLNFYLSEGTFDYTPPVLGALTGCTIRFSLYSYGFRYSVLFDGVAYCEASFTPQLILRYFLGLPIAALIYFCSPYVFSRLFHIIFSVLGFRTIPYSTFGSNLRANIRAESKRVDDEENKKESQNGLKKKALSKANDGILDPNKMPKSWLRFVVKYFQYVAVSLWFGLFSVLFFNQIGLISNSVF